MNNYLTLNEPARKRRKLSNQKIMKSTRLHSSRMHIARLLTVSPSMHCTGGGVCSVGGAWSWGVCSSGEVVSQHALRQTPPHCEQNSWHTLLKILPCPKLRLRAVISIHNWEQLCKLSLSISLSGGWPASMKRPVFAASLTESQTEVVPSGSPDRCFR